jgi:hypothetical protein
LALNHKFSLLHDVAPNAFSDASWTFCNKCGALYRSAGSDRLCPVDDVSGHDHQRSATEYVLAHGFVAPVVFKGNIVSGGLAALDGWSELTILLMVQPVGRDTHTMRGLTTTTFLFRWWKNIR